MGYSKEHIAATRARIVEAAGRVFRRNGYEAAKIDAIMAEAGLTRGGFYAHFQSKKTLFEAVMAERFDFTNQIDRLNAAGLTGPVALAKAGSEYLRHDRRDTIGEACCMASSAIDAMRAGPVARAAFGGQLRDLAERVAANGVEPPLPMLATAVGALILARASDDELAAEVLRDALAALEASLVE
ncbi:MAG: TetR/AcrR family transcriptional regulator [Rhodobacteraceae bacterium]|nr:TetR/AcrR family transcriptional regulator [Paracoccaceae bacterium]